MVTVEGAVNHPARGIQHITLFDRDSNRFCSNSRTFPNRPSELPLQAARRHGRFVRYFESPPTETAWSAQRPFSPDGCESRDEPVDRCRALALIVGRQGVEDFWLHSLGVERRKRLRIDALTDCRSSMALPPPPRIRYALGYR